MARRRTKTRTRRRFTGVNLLNLAETAAYANIITQTAFKAPLGEFLTGKVGAGASNQLTLRELIDGALGGSAGQHSSFTTQFGSGGIINTVRANTQGQLGQMAISLAATGIGFTLAKKLTSKPRRQMNQLLKMGGLGSTVRV